MSDDIEVPNDDYAYFDGYGAFEAGFGLETCPYPTDSPERVDWIDGWSDAQMDAEPW